MKKLLGVLLVVLIVSVIFALFSTWYKNRIKEMPPVLGDSSSQKTTPTLGVEPMPAFSKNKDAQIDRPTATEEIINGYVVRGKASGTWLFEASTEVRLETIQGELISSQIAQVAEGVDWMTTNLVPWTATIVFSTSSKALIGLTPEQKAQGIDAQVVLVKSNPSGEPERDERLVQKVKLKIDQEQMMPL